MYLSVLLCLYKSWLAELFDPAYWGLSKITEVINVVPERTNFSVFPVLLEIRQKSWQALK